MKQLFWIISTLLLISCNQAIRKPSAVATPTLSPPSSPAPTTMPTATQPTEKPDSDPEPEFIPSQRITEATSEETEPTTYVRSLPARDITTIETAWQARFSPVTGVVIRQHGEVVFEGYNKHQKPETKMELYSVTKSVVSVLTGIALTEGHLTSLDDPISLFLPEYTADLDSATQAITVADVLSMATGLQSGWSMEGNPITSYRGDLHQNALDLEQVADPGTVSQYSTLVVSLMTGILESATGEDLEIYANRVLFTPLGITDWKWYRDDTERITSGSGLKLRTTDMAKIGQLVLDGGVWNGQRLLSAAYIAQATQSLYPTDGGGREIFGYGYLFWVSESSEFGNFFASGYAGQYIYVVPEYDLVIAISTPCCKGYGGGIRELAEEVIAPLFAPNPSACPIERGERTILTIEDADGDEQVNYIYLPPCYAESDATYPVLYLLHGGGLDSFTWLKLGAGDESDRLIGAGEIEPMIIVSPPAPPNGTFDGYLFDHLIPRIEAEYRTNGQRGLAGMSLGGGLTARVGLTYPGEFDALGILSMTYVGGNQQDFANWLDALETVPALYLDVGEDDGFSRYHEQVRTMLDERSIPYTYQTHPGGHRLGYWSKYLPTYLRWFSGQFDNE